MKTKFLFILIGIIIVLFLTGCSTSESEMNDDIFNQTTEATTMAPAQNQDGDPVENQEIQQVESIDDSTIKRVLGNMFSMMKKQK